MNWLRLSNRARRIASLLVLIATVVVIARADAAYRVTRPIAIDANYGYINQGYLYGEGTGVHKGVDFPAPLDRSVYAISDGVVREVNEEGADNCRQGQLNCGAFGNYILVRHTQQHFKRTPTPGQMAYVYSLYAHLSWHGASVNPDDNIVAGQIIGDVDNT